MRLPFFAIKPPIILINIVFVLNEKEAPLGASTFSYLNKSFGTEIRGSQNSLQNLRYFELLQIQIPVFVQL